MLTAGGAIFDKHFPKIHATYQWATYLHMQIVYKCVKYIHFKNIYTTHSFEINIRIYCNS